MGSRDQTQILMLVWAALIRLASPCLAFQSRNGKDCRCVLFFPFDEPASPSHALVNISFEGFSENAAM